MNPFRDLVPFVDLLPSATSCPSSPSATSCPSSDGSAPPRRPGGPDRSGVTKTNDFASTNARVREDFDTDTTSYERATLSSSTITHEDGPGGADDGAEMDGRQVVQVDDASLHDGADASLRSHGSGQDHATSTITHKISSIKNTDETADETADQDGAEQMDGRPHSIVQVDHRPSLHDHADEFLWSHGSGLVRIVARLRLPPGIFGLLGDSSGRGADGIDYPALKAFGEHVSFFAHVVSS